MVYGIGGGLGNPSGGGLLFMFAVSGVSLSFAFLKQESGNESDVANQMGLSRSRLNDRYRSMDKLKTAASKANIVQRSESHRHR